MNCRPFLGSLLVVFAGCASYNPTVAPNAHPLSTRVTSATGAVTASADPYIEPDRQKATFDARFTKAGVLPIHVAVRNNGDRPLAVRPSDLRVRMPNGTELSPSPPTTVVARLKRSDHTAAMVFGGVLGFLAAQQAEQQARAERLADYRSKLLKDATLAKDTSAEGFVFFVLADKNESFADATLHVRFVDVEAGTSTVVALPIVSEPSRQIAGDDAATWPMTHIYDTKSIAGTWTGTVTLPGTAAVPVTLVLREDGSYESSTPSSRLVGSYGITGGKARYRSPSSGRTGIFELRERDAQRVLVITIDGGGGGNLKPVSR